MRPKNTPSKYRIRFHACLKIFRSGDYEAIDREIEAMRNEQDPQLFSMLLEDCYIKNDGTLQTSEALTITGLRQPATDYAIFNLIGYAPKKTVLNTSIRRNRITQIRFECYETYATSYHIMERFPMGIYRFSKLRSLNVDRGFIKALPVGISALRELVLLEVRNNGLEALPEDIGGCKWLKKIDAGGNAIKILPNALFTLHELKELNLEENNLISLPDCIDGLTAMQKLNLNSNKLKTLPESFGKLPALHDLDLSNNMLEQVPSALLSLTKLQNLILSYNELRTIPSGIGKMKQLKMICLTGNRDLESLPAELTHLSSLESLNLGICKIVMPKPYLKSMRGAEIEAYFNKIRRYYKLPVIKPVVSKTNKKTEAFKADYALKPAINGKKAFSRIEVPQGPAAHLKSYLDSDNKHTLDAGIQLLRALDDKAAYEAILQEWVINLSLEKSGNRPCHEFTGNRYVYLNSEDIEAYAFLSTILDSENEYIASHFNSRAMTRLEVYFNPDHIPGLFERFPSLQWLSMNCRDKSLPAPLDGCTALRELELVNLESLSNLKLDKFPEMQKLSVQKSKKPGDFILDGHRALQSITLESLPEGRISICNLPDLESLTIRGAKCRELTIVNCPKLADMDLSYIEQNESVSFTNLPALRNLRVKHFRNPSLAMALPGFESLEQMELESCGINQLPEITTDHAPLFSLKISDNALTTIPDSFGKLSKLKELDLSRNMLQTFPYALSTLTCLRELELSSNNIKELPSFCNNLVSLEELNLRYNDVRTLPDHMDGLIRLKKIDLSRQGDTKNGSLRVSSIPADLITRLAEKDLLLDWSIVKKRKLEAVRYALSYKKSL